MGCAEIGWLKVTSVRLVAPTTRAKRVYHTETILHGGCMAYACGMVGLRETVSTFPCFCKAKFDEMAGSGRTDATPGAVVLSNARTSSRCVINQTCR